MWHASVSYHVSYKPVHPDQWPRAVRQAAERLAKQLVAGVGEGRRVWQHGSPTGAHVVHVRRSLSDAERDWLVDGPPAAVRGGDFGAAYACRTTAP